MSTGHCPVFGIAILKTRLKPKSNTNQIIIFSGLMILLQQESYERSIILGASCKHVFSNVTLLIWQQTNNRLTTFSLVMGINAGKRIWGSEGGASYEHKGYENDWLPVYPFPINTFFTAVSIMVGHNMGGAQSSCTEVEFGWRLSDPLGVRYFRKFGGKLVQGHFCHVCRT